MIFILAKDNGNMLRETHLNETINVNFKIFKKKTNNNKKIIIDFK